MKELTKENLKSYVIQFSKIFGGIDFEEQLRQEESKLIPIGELFFSKDVFSVYKYAVEDMLIEALITFHDLIKDSIKHISIPSTSQELKNLSISLNELTNMLEFCEFHSNEIMDRFVDQYKDYPLFQGHNIKEELGDLWIFPRMEKALSKGLFKIYSYYIDNPNIPTKESSFFLNPNLYIVDSINSFLRFAKKQNNDDVRATYLLKIEDILSYSYFVLVIQYKGNVWVGTDKMMFANPNIHRRNADRTREDHFDYLDLPYGLLDELDEIRKLTKVPVPNSGMELHIYKMTDLPIGNKVFMHQLAAHLISNLEGQQLQQITSYEDVMLALPSGEEIRKEINFSSDNYKGVNERVKEIQNLFKNESSTELAVINKDIVLKSEYYDPEWLATPESFQNLNNWIANKKIKDDYENKLEKLYPFSDDNKTAYEIRDSLHKEFAKILSIHLNTIFQYVFVADTVYIKIIKDISKFASNDNSSLIVILTGVGGSCAPVKIKDPLGTYKHKGTCQICNKHKESRILRVTFHSSKELQIMFGLEWKDIPDWFKLYRYHGLIPYHGNSILDNVDPLAMIEDNVSRRYPNGFNIDISMCGWCNNQLIKKYKKYDKAIIEFDFAKGEILSIKEKPKDLIINGGGNILI